MAKIIWGLVMGSGFQKTQRIKIKEKLQARTTRVIKKKKSFYSYWMNDFSYNHISLEVHVIIVFNASHCFVSQKTHFSGKDKPS